MNNILTNDRSTKLLTFLLLAMLIIVLGMTTILLWLTFHANQVLHFLIMFIGIFTLSIIAMAIILTVITIGFLCHNKKVPRIAKNIVETFIAIIYPIIVLMAKTMGYDKNVIRGIYTKINNQFILGNRYSFRGEEVLILSPHCLQKAFCPHKITNDTNNCKRCGQCDVDSLLNLKEKYGVEFKIVTGGTLARKVIGDIRPKAIIAIACERDLFSGLMDVKKIPILAIINKRPEGPCINTQVDLSKVEKAILHFIKE